MSKHYCHYNKELNRTCMPGCYRVCKLSQNSMQKYWGCLLLMHSYPPILMLLLDLTTQYKTNRWKSYICLDLSWTDNAAIRAHLFQWIPEHAIFSVQDFKECMRLVDVVPTKVLSRESREFEETREEICGKVRPNARMSWRTMGKQAINPRVGTHAQ
jgi:hypothetical protein